MTSEGNGLREKIKIEPVEDFEYENFVSLKACDIKVEGDYSRDEDFASFCNDDIKIEIDEVLPVQNNASSQNNNLNIENAENELSLVEIKIENFLDQEDEMSNIFQTNKTSLLNEAVAINEAQQIVASEGLTYTESLGNTVMNGEGSVRIQASLPPDSNPSVRVEQCFQINTHNSGNRAAGPCGKSLLNKII